VAGKILKLNAAVARRTDLTPSDKLVLAVLSAYAGANRATWPGVRVLARESGLHRVTVLRAIRRLETRGLMVSGYRKSPANRSSVAKCDRSQNATVRKMRPTLVAKCDQPWSQNATPLGCKMRPVAKCDQSQNATISGRITDGGSDGNGDSYARAHARDSTNSSNIVTNRSLSNSNPLKGGDKRGGKERRHEPFADAFREAFESHFGTTYSWAKSDFVQLAAWRKNWPAVSPGEFAETAKRLWSLGQFAPAASLTIRGMCARWPQLQATLRLRGGGSRYDIHPDGYDEGICVNDRNDRP